MTNTPRVVDEGIPYGVYVWRINGKAVVNENFEYLVAPARRGDLAAIARLKKFVNLELGILEGEAVFEEGSRPISQQEWELQMERLLNGETPDPYDLGNLLDEQRSKKEFGR
jgi:hypothetical protein